MVNLYLVAAGVSCVLGMAWLALAMDGHWKQVRNDRPTPKTVRLLRSLGGLALGASLLLCLRADHASMASLVWIMLLAASALGVALTLTWCPRVWAPAIAWLSATD